MTSLAALRPRDLIALTPATSGRRRAQHFVPDHPGWFRVDDPLQGWCRVAAGDARGPLILASPDLRAPGHYATEPAVMPLSSEAAALLPRPLSERLQRRSPLARIPSPSVWEAAATAVIRQVVHRDQAKLAFRRLAELIGPPVLLAGEVRHGFPTAEAVLNAGPDRLRQSGIGFKARTLKTLADWCLDAQEHVAAEALHCALVGLRGVGPWTASVAVCDRFSNFDFYPVDDLAVRAHAAARWPERRWPEKPAAFAREWRSATEPFTGEVTAFVLADAVLSGS
jgi:DNA-3-methyladenine glycosylase II